MNDAAVRTSASKRRILLGVIRLTLILGGLLALYAVLPFQGDDWAIGAVVGVVAIVSIIPFTIKRVDDIDDSPYPAMAMVESLTMIAAMLVLGFSGLYLTIDRNGTQFNGLETRVDAVYFTVTTLSTVGFGDINASGQSARVMVTIQVMLNFTLFAFAVKTVTGSASTRLGINSPADHLRRNKPTSVEETLGGALEQLDGLEHRNDDSA